ncbi:MAG TPA: hypothetical protein PKW98_06755 [Candidatus Wallbacteria bacterium]|nr:MAG: hypothetical protein BWY32_01025 [bacterium ADurb.Bin243]HOD40365.1 hypothetical protein [Candidatus Wallbacteria bacterium]HPG57498.1 hypothetical protein [Candidatus Wallbacteria bacterium]
MALLNFPAIIIKTPLKLMDIKFLASLINKCGAATVFLNGAGGLNSFIVKNALDCELKRGLDYGLIIDFRGRSESALDSDVISAAEMNFKFIFLDEPGPKSKPALCGISSYGFISGIKKKYAAKFKIIVQNCFLHKNDEELLAMQLESGADLAAVRPGPARPEFLAKYKDRAAFLKSLTAAELDGPGFRGCETGALYELDYSSAAQEGLI